MQKRVYPRGVVSPKNAPPMISICYQPPPCLKGRIQPLQIRATICFRRLSLRFTLNLQQRDQRSASFTLVALVCHKESACGCTRTLDLWADTSSTGISSRFQMICTMSALFAGRSWSQSPRYWIIRKGCMGLSPALLKQPLVWHE